MDQVSRGEFRLPKVQRACPWEPAQAAGLADLVTRLFRKKLIDILQRGNEHPNFDLRSNYSLKVTAAGLSDVERNALAGLTDDDINLAP